LRLGFRVNVRWRIGIAVGIGLLVLAWLRVPPAATFPDRPPAPDDVPDTAPDPSLSPLRLTGEVVDAEGRPVSGAPVTLADPAGRGDVLAPGRSREFRDRRTTTDEEGRFRFEGLAPGRKILVARPEGRAPACAELSLLRSETHHRLTLPPPVTLHGQTSARARLFFTCRIPGMPAAGHEPLTSGATADDAGDYHVSGLPASISVTVRLEAPGYPGRLFGPYQFPPGIHRLDFPLDTGFTLRGRIRDGAGRPVAGARVAFDAALTTTEADGTFLLAGLEDRASTLVASREGHLQTAVPSVRPGSIDVTLPRSAEIRGRVTGGRARYLCFTSGDARYRLGLGDSDTFRIPGVPPGPLRLDVEDEEGRILGTVLVDAPEGGCVEGVEILLR
jgi:protocatechuate 3,4-dioxygenase beta subunit